MTAIKIENVKCELNEDVKWRSYFVKVEDVKLEYCFAESERVKFEPEEYDRAPNKYSRPPPKTPAERKRAQREREKQLRQELGLIRLRGPPKSAAERKRAQREREKQIRKQIELLYPKRLVKIPGESRKVRIERERQLKLELGLISPRGPPKTAAERKRAQREREKQMKLEVALVSSEAARKIKRLQEERQHLSLKSGTIHIEDNGVGKNQQKINIGLLKPKSPPLQKHQQLRKELKPLSTNTSNKPTEIKSVLKFAECCEDHIPKSRLPTGENVKPVYNLEFVDCSKVSSTDSPPVACIKF